MAKLEIVDINYDVGNINYDKFDKEFWTNEQLKELREKYLYYLKHKEEAEKYFQKSWNAIRKKASRLRLSLKCHLTINQLEELKKNYFYYIDHKKEAEEYFQRKWSNIKTIAATLKITSMKINKECNLFLGCNVAEKVLSHVFRDVERMPCNNPGFDFICNKGFKIDVKSCCLSINNTYQFIINRNKVANYFLCIGFDNRENLNPQHIWLIKSDEIHIKHCAIGTRYVKFNELVSFRIENALEGLSKYSKYELIYKLKDVVDCCNELKR